MSKVVCFGEIMLRLNPDGYLRFVQAPYFMASYAGGEANVAVSLTHYGVDAGYVTKLPKNDIASTAVRSLMAHGVDVSRITYGGERMGIYFLEKGASQRASKVIYDRKHSSIAEATDADFDWDAIFNGAQWFHFTGITPALNDNVAEICATACKKAKEMGVTVSCDLNYRKNLWSSVKAQQVMSNLMQYVDVCIANEEDAELVLGIRAANSDVESGELSREGYVDVAKEITARFGTRAVAITLRRSISASDNEWGGMLYADGKAYFSRDYLIHIVDRVGGGDSFGGGLIYAMLNGYDPQKTIEFATAASCLKHTIEYDFNEVSVSEVEALIKGGGFGRVQR